jgi:Domain of unknown function (DUF4432)
MSSSPIASLDQVARVSKSRIDGGPGDGMRVIDVALLDGFSFRVLPDRGLDIGAVWCASGKGRMVPISWTSKLGEEQPPLDFPSGSAWITRFSGGLLTTCGIDNVGPSSEGIGLHGSFSHRRASDVVVRRSLVEGVDELTACKGAKDESSLVQVTISGVIEDSNALSRHVRVRRTITSSTGSARISLVDVVENLGPKPEPIPLLYHCNFGFPLWSEGATVSFPAGTTAVPRDRDASADLNTSGFPGVGPGWVERVYEQCLPAGSASTRILSPRTSLGVDLSWSGETLDRCIQWIHPGSGVSALGVEPSNSSVLGRAHDRSEGRLPHLEAGATKTFWVEISASPLEAVLNDA